MGNCPLFNKFLCLFGATTTTTTTTKTNTDPKRKLLHFFGLTSKGIHTHLYSFPHFGPNQIKQLLIVSIQTIYLSKLICLKLFKSKSKPYYIRACVCVHTYIPGLLYLFEITLTINETIQIMRKEINYTMKNIKL